MTEYFLNEPQALLIAMKADSEVSERIRSEMIDVIMAWHRGRLLPKAQVPTLTGLCKEFGQS